MGALASAILGLPTLREEGREHLNLNENLPCVRKQVCGKYFRRVIGGTL